MRDTSSAAREPSGAFPAYLRMEAALRRSNLRLDVARRYRKVKDVFSDNDSSL